MLRTILLAGAAVLIGAPAAMADAGSNFQPYMFQHPAFGAQSQAAPQSGTPATANRPEASNQAASERAARTPRRHMVNRTGGITQQRMTAAAGTEQPVGQTWNSPSQTMYYPPNGPYAWGYAPGPSYGYAPGGYYGPNYASMPYNGGGVVEGRAAYEGPSGWGPDYPEVGPPVGQTMNNPPSASMYFTNAGPY